MKLDTARKYFKKHVDIVNQELFKEFLLLFVDLLLIFL
jgi:hypothetical protein